MIGRGLLFCIALLTAVPAFAASRDIVTTPAGEKRVALVIGNGAYKNISPLANPPNDAQLMAQTLSAVGFELVGGKALIDADKATTERAIRDFGRALAGGAVGLFYYAGHGVQVNGANYLIPVAANVTGEADIKYELVDAGFVLDEMSNAGNRLNIVILDACRNNPFGGRGLRAVSSGLAQVTAPAGTVISYATQPGNVASDGVGGNSPYTSALADAVKMQGADLFETFNTVGLKVKQVSGGKQQPWLATSPVEGKFYFAGLPASATVTPSQNTGPTFDPRALELSFWDSIKTSANLADYKAYLEQFPTGQFAGLASLRIKDIEAASTQQTQVASAGQLVSAEGSLPGAWVLQDYGWCRNHDFQILDVTANSVNIKGSWCGTKISGGTVQGDKLTLSLKPLWPGSPSVRVGRIISPTHIEGITTDGNRFTIDKR